MSYELNVYLQNPSPLDTILSRFEALGFKREESPHGSKSTEIVLTDETQSTVFVYGPTKIESNLPTAGDVSNEHWLVTFGISGTSEKLGAIKNLALSLSRDYGGFVRDPQTANPVEELRLNKCSFLFCANITTFTSSSIMDFLEQVSNSFPHVTPFNVGNCEPPAIRYDGSIKQKTRIAAIAEKETLIIAKSPTGDFSATVDFDSTPDETSEPCAMIQMEVSESNSLVLVDFFRRVCRLLKCFYGGAIFYKPSDFNPKELYRHTRWKISSSGYWNGIPANNTWLAYFSGTTKRQIEKYIDGQTIEDEDALLMILADKPSTEKELERIFPRLPDSALDLDGEF